ncbi:MAG: thiamine phosphate synthase [Eubacteriales bacterium]
MFSIYRIADANFNRAREGLRVVEELARFVLNDAVLAGMLKSMRHQLRSIQQEWPGGIEKFMSERDSQTDVGFDSREEKELERLNFLELSLANFKRVQEAMRVLEEYAKFISAGADFKKIRFELYDLEKKMTFKLVELKANELYNVDYTLYVIVGERFSGGRDTVEVVRSAISGGATVIQLRDKESSDSRLLGKSLELRRLTHSKGVPLIINDRIDIALAVDADGVHLGQDDLPVSTARQLLGPGKIIGLSTHSLEQARRARRQGADYIGVGPVFDNKTKENGEKPVGLELLRQVSGEIDLPWVAIGGINKSNVSEVISAGAKGVAVVTAVVSAPDIRAAALFLREEIVKTRSSQMTNNI